MDAYIIYPNVLTSLGANQAFWDNLLAGECGLTPSEDVYPDWFAGNKSPIGAIKGLSQTGSRLRQILELLLGDEELMLLNQCDALLGASSLGDLEGEYSGDVHACLKDFLQEKSPELANKLQHVISSACSSGTDVLSTAAILTDEKVFDIVGVVAADCLDPGKLLQHFALGTQSPETCRPFDANRSGTSFGEGGAFALVVNESGLTRVRRAMKEKLGVESQICYQILGFGLSCDAMHITAPDETGEIPSLAVSRAVGSSSCDVSDIGYINAHASGTPLNEEVESKSLNIALGKPLQNIVTGGTKGAIGHLLGATGLVEAIVACWCLEHEKVPGTVGLSEKDEAVLLNTYVSGDTQVLPTPVAMSTTFGFGGVNSAIVIKKMESVNEEVRDTWKV